MDKAFQLLKELRGMSAVTSDKVDELLRLCLQSGVPCVTVYSPTRYEGWYEMQRAYVFTKRKDVHKHIWYFSPRSGLLVSDRNGKNCMPFAQWDPEADLFTDQSLYEGGTNMNPVERERLGKNG